MVEIICNKCKKKVSKENRVRYTGAFGHRKICRKCLNKISRENGRKKSEALKLYRSFWS